MKILKKKINFALLVIIATLVIVTPVQGAITVSQNAEILTVNNSIDQNITIEFYDSHQVFLATEINFTAYPEVNITIPSAVSQTGGYFRIALVNESITLEAFGIIVPWIDDNANIAPNTEITVVEGNNTAQDLAVGIISGNNGKSIDGVYVAIGFSIVGITASSKRAKNKKVK